MFRQFTSRLNKQFFSGFKTAGSNTSKSYATYHYFGGQSTNSYSQLVNFTPQTKRNLKIVGVVLGIVIVSHIEQAPVTHRYRVMLTPNWIENKSAAISYDSVMAQFGRQMLPESHPATVKVRNVMLRLIKAASNYYDPDTGKTVNLFEDLKTHTVPALDWEIKVIDDSKQPTPNAFVIGNGKVFVFVSMMEMCGDDDRLATVLAHELGHQLAHHIGEKLTKSPFFISISLLLSSLTGLSDLSQITTSLLLDMPTSREMETEADYIGLMVMANACFDPHKAPGFWKTMIDYEKTHGTVPEILSTHPSSARRNQNLVEWMPKADKLTNYADCSATASNYSLFRSSW